MKHADRRPFERATFVGVDWSGAKHAQRKIWAAAISGGALVWVLRPPADIVAWMHALDFTALGFDFCFSLAEAQLERVHLPRSPRALAAEILRRWRSAEEFARAVAPEAWRRTDKAIKAPFAATNLRNFRQTYAGMRVLAQLDDSYRIVPFDPPGRRAIVEVLPVRFGRTVGGYKGKTIDARRARLQLSRTLPLQLTRGQRATLVDDTEGDALDAVFAALCTQAAHESDYAGVPAVALTSGEGWIF